MKLRNFFLLLAAVVLGTPTAADAAIRTVRPGQSIQAAIDAAAPGDTILVEPGIYQEVGNADFGLRISTANLRLIGKRGHQGKVRLVQYGTQRTGIYAAPAACGPSVGVGGCPDELKGFHIRGFSVEDFPFNGIQTRFVKDFSIVDNESVRNLENGIYPTISARGLVANNVSYGSLDTALWVAASENVRVIGNDLSQSPIGFEITVSNNVWATFNHVHNNTVGFGLFHPNAAGNAQLPVMANWVIENNHIHDNNLPNPAPPGSFQAGLPAGVGVMLLGVSNHVVSKNRIENNDFSGIAMLDWCFAIAVGDPSRACDVRPPIAEPAANDNRVTGNYLKNNGTQPPPGIPLPGADILHLQFVPSSGNCFQNNKPDDFTFLTVPGPLLPTDGC